MSAFPSDRIRIFADIEALDNPLNVLTGAAPVVLPATDFQVEVGCALAGAIITDVSGLTNIIVQIIPAGTNGAAPAAGTTPALTKTVSSLDNTVTANNWADGTHQHAVAAFTNAANTLTAGSYWLYIYATTSDSTARLVPLASGPMRVINP
jgi:hypothetical protein